MTFFIYPGRYWRHLWGTPACHQLDTTTDHRCITLITCLLFTLLFRWIQIVIGINILFVNTSICISLTFYLGSPYVFHQQRIWKLTLMRTTTEDRQKKQHGKMHLQEIHKSTSSHLVWVTHNCGSMYLFFVTVPSLSWSWKLWHRWHG